MKKYLIEEVPGEFADLSFYFDGDNFNENSGDYCNTLFIIQREHGRIFGLNSDEYERLTTELYELLDEFDYVKDNGRDYEGRPVTYKKVMANYGIKYNPTTCHKLRLFYETDPEYNKPEAIAEYLTIKTGKNWETTSAHGYYQGDFCEIIYCSTNYTEKDASEAGEVFLGAAHEYVVVYLDENGEETERVGGYIIPDSIWEDEERKKLVCEWACIAPEETTMKVISGYSTKTIYEYKEM